MTMPVEHLLPVQSLPLIEEASRETAAVAATPGPPYTLHTITPGDTLWDIAHRYGISLQWVLASNPDLAARPHLIRPGEQVLIPHGEGVVHRLRPGERLEEMVALYGIEVETVLSHPANAGGAVSLAHGVVFVPSPRLPDMAPGIAPWHRQVVLGETTPDDGMPRGAPVLGIITSRFGELAPELRRGPHTGVDIAAPLGAPVHATAPGKVLLVGYEENGYGLYIVIEHGAGLSTLYAHLEMAFVRRGDQVMRGQAIGRVGSSGRSTGPHLHYEVRLAGRPVDPGPYMALEGR